MYIGVRRGGAGVRAAVLNIIPKVCAGGAGSVQFSSDNNRRQASECAHTHAASTCGKQQMALGASENRASGGGGTPGGGMFTYHPPELHGFSVKLISTDLRYS